ncbi:MAG: peptidase S24 [Methylotenera sp.]|nr:MAG: peptidase S24 [Methylotenera sp.]
MTSTHGGSRPNSGRKTPASPYGEKTSVVRVPNSIKDDVLVYLKAFKKKPVNKAAPVLNLPQAMQNPPKLARPVYSYSISAGQSRFPSPAQDYEQKFLDLNELCIKNPAATFFFTASGKSMEGARIFDGDLLLVDRSLPHKYGAIVVAAVDGEWVVKRLYKRGGVVKLLSEHPDFPPITFSEGQELVIFGVVRRVLPPPL